MAGRHYGTGAYSAGLTHPPGFPGDKENKAFAEGAIGAPATNPHVAGTPAALAYDAGAAAGLQHEIPGTGINDDYAPIAKGFDFTGSAGDGAVTDADIDPDRPTILSLKFRSDSLVGNQYLFNLENNSFRVRITASTGVIQAQVAGGLGAFNDLVVAASKEYKLDYIQTQDDLLTITLHNITDKTSVSESVAGYTTDRTAGLLGIAGLYNHASENFKGIISDFKIGYNGFIYNHWWKFDEGTGVAVVDHIGSLDLTIAAGSGSWV